ncbi:HD domain-containing protein [Confluentibacter lentus]|uniref:HD domain-containing protein n=1 Tax=Confluentibacter lentus TaxID=1699412 RepID=UPI000C281D9B|nr:ATP-binding protein [Confluentibacter lentus]
MANIKLPKKFKQLLKKNQKIDGIVKQTLFDFGEILTENRLYFFDEYTDHGIKHVENIMFGTDKLITNNTYENVLQTEDIMFYVLAVLLHDIGMHITYEGFKILLNGGHDDILISDFDNITWSNLWLEYLAEAKRFSGKQLLSIFGDEEAIIRNPMDFNKGELNGNDRKLIGEFIRRHHPRLAHEIALIGFPGKSKSSIAFAKELSLENRKLIGLIARSHGVDLRKCVEYVEIEYGKTKRTPLGVHVNYLMILLRLADYIQIDRTRTSEVVMRTKTFESPISKIEHNSHLSIDYVDDKYQDDPERIFVTASPENSNMYLKLKKLFYDIQKEFDISWAVLGELYGNLENKPEIKFRRITSNLDTEVFINKQDYVGDYFSFKSNDEIIKLLIAPLYGDNPTYGVRELLQNCIDACNERKELEKNSLSYSYIPKINVSIYENDDNHFFEIKDNGKGMNINIIKKYFLSAGASYRNSREWKEKFIDESGSSKIQRNGRFGIGVLACFLIGDKISVTTREINSDFGYNFMASLSSNQINVVKNYDLDFGTKIIINTSKEVIEKLKDEDHWYDESVGWTRWYTLTTPEIVYSKYGEIKKSFKNKDPHYLDSSIPNDWNSIDHEGFNKILWTYSKEYSNRSIVCNGLVVIKKSHDKVIKINFIKNLPKILVFDNNGLMPLSLNRNTLIDTPSFEETLIESIYKDYLSSVLCNKTIKSPKENIISFKSFKIDYGGTEIWYKWGKKEENILYEILLSKKGFIIDYNYFLNKIRDYNLIYIQSESFNKKTDIQLDIKNNFIKMSYINLRSIYEYKKAIEQEDYFTKNKKQISKTTAFLKQEKFNFLFIKKTNRFSKYIYDEYKIEYDYKGWVSINIKNAKETSITKEFLSNNPRINFIREAPIVHNTNNDDILDRVLNRYLGNDPIIPYEFEDRKKKFPLAFKELDCYMKKYI